MKTSHLLLSASIVACTCIAWFILGSAITNRTRVSTGTMQNEVSGVWGPALVQAHPDAFFLTPNAPGGRAVVLPSASKATVRLDSEPKRRGLLWHRTYAVGFEADYLFTNPTPIPQTLYFRFPLPADSAGLHGFLFQVGDEAASNTAADDGVVTRAVVVPAGESVPMKVAYRTRGTDSWNYRFIDARRITGFELRMRVNFADINFPVGTGSPDERMRDESGWDLAWTYPDVISAPRQNDYYVTASEKDIQQAQEDLSLNVALSYLNILFAYKNADIAENRVKLSKDQLSNLDKMIQAGTKPENDRYDILAQLAADEQTLITAQNAIENNLLALKQLMYMEVNYPLVIDRPLLNLETLEALENQPFESVYSIALGNQPQIKAAELRQQASEEGIDIARSQRIPSLSIGGNFGTNWSNFAKLPNGEYAIDRIQQPGVYINGDPALFEIDNYTPTGFTPIGYGTQLDQNIGYGWGATLSIPILNNYTGKASVERAKINVINADIETEKLKQTLKTNIQNALTSARAARKSLEGAQAAFNAASIALANADRKAAVGALNNFEYLSARSRSDTAESNLLIAKYDYYFQIKVIEYYMGRGIRLD